MNTLLISLLIVNIATVVTAVKIIEDKIKKLNERIDKETLDIKEKLSRNSTELNIVKEVILDEIKDFKCGITNEIKNEIEGQVIKLAFTPIKLNLK